MAPRVFPSHEAINPFGNITLIQSGFPMTHAFTFDTKIGLFVPKLMQESKNDIDSTKHFGIFITQVQQFELARYFKI